MSSLSTTSSMSRLDLTMESLALPQELYWDGKMEPTSPSSVSSELFALNESAPTWFYDDNFANGLTIINDESSDGNEEDLELFNGEDIVVELMDFKEDYLLDAKVQTLPLIDFVNCVEVAHPNALTKVHATNEQLGNFGTGSFDNAVLAQLTPPQSPPQCSSNTSSSVASYQQQPMPIEETKNYTPAVVAYNNTPTTNFVYNDWQNNINNNNNTSANTNVEVASNAPANTNNNNNDIEREMQIIDEIVNIRAQELHNWPCKVDYDDCASQASSSYSATPSQAESQLSNSSSNNSCIDDDWSAPSGANSSYCSSNGSSPIHNSSASEDLSNYHELATNGQAYTSTPTSSSSATKKRTRTYGRGVEDRKIRKKEQNKNAATRYRQKKKLEMEYVQSEEYVLVQRNDELRRILADRKHEAKYLRKLLREFYQGRKV